MGDNQGTACSPPGASSACPQHLSLHHPLCLMSCLPTPIILILSNRALRSNPEFLVFTAVCSLFPLLPSLTACSALCGRPSVWAPGCYRATGLCSFSGKGTISELWHIDSLILVSAIPLSSSFWKLTALG